MMVDGGDGDVVELDGGDKPAREENEAGNTGGNVQA